ncbi:MAG: ABC transporter ATP-binding protein [Rhodospirillales bacterium]
MNAATARKTAPGAAPATEKTPRLRVRGLKKAFGANSVLNGVDLDVMPGESVALVGRSGSGKSVLAKCILGLIPPDEGAVEIDGRDVAGMSRRERDAAYAKFGCLFQNGALFDSLLVWQNVSFALMSARGWKLDKAKALAVDRLRDVGMDAAVGDLVPAELSGGMQKRAAFARAIAASPEMVVLDDPTAGLDPIVTTAISKLIQKIIRDAGATVLSISQDLTVIHNIADRVAMLYEGKIIWTGPAATVEKSGDAFVEQFINGRRQGPIAADVV